MESKVSVIVPVYNTEQYLGDCLDSLCRQSLQDIEIFCINDGSTDGSKEILESYCEKDPRIHVLHQENQGVCISRNRGLLAASGKYIQFVDSDDMLEADALEYLFNKMEKEQLDVFYYDARAIFASYELEEEKSNYKTYYKRNKSYNQIVKGSQLFTTLIHEGKFLPSAYLQMIRREFLLQSKVQFIPGIVQEDNAFTTELMLHAQRVSHENKPFYIRRVRPSSIMTEKPVFTNAYGYFRCAVALAKYFLDSSYSTDTLSALDNFSQSLLTRMENIYSHLTEEDKADIKKLPDEEQAAMFYLCRLREILIQNGAANRRKANELQKLQTALQDTNKQISSLKHENTVQIDQNLKYLNQFIEIEKLNGIQREQIDALEKQKVEISHKSMALEEKVRLYEKENENIRKKLSSIEHSYGFRLERLLMYFPEKIRKYKSKR